MKLRSNAYYMLISSLPPLPPRFEVDRLPITLERLQNRLRMLEPEDAQEIDRMFKVLRWSRQFEESNDAAVVKRYAELMQDVTNQLVREVLTDWMDVRMITTALRRRRRGLGPPTIGIGRWLEHIRRHFNKPDLGLGHAFPRIAEYERLLEQGDVLNLYRRLLEATWVYLKRRAEDYTFSFEAVVLYVGRWNIIRHWQELQAERGRPIFESLVTEAMGEYANIYP
jgi:Protein of unknown function (DUF2764)